MKHLLNYGSCRHKTDLKSSCYYLPSPTPHTHFQEGISDVITFNWKSFNVFMEYLQLMKTYDKRKIRRKDIALTWKETEDGINKLL